MAVETVGKRGLPGTASDLHRLDSRSVAHRKIETDLSHRPSRGVVGGLREKAHGSGLRNFDRGWFSASNDDRQKIKECLGKSSQTWTEYAISLSLSFSLSLLRSSQMSKSQGQRTATTKGKESS
jgi:hypothetical protein